MKSYTQLTQEERYQIHALMKAGLNPTEIATWGSRNMRNMGVMRNMGAGLAF